MSVRDVIQAAAGSAGDSKTYIEDVFSTYLYTGNGSTQTINNGIDLAGKGGMVWIKGRSANTQTLSHVITDSVIGNGYWLDSASTSGSNYSANIVTRNSNGFTTSSSFRVTQSGDNFASWTFRKAPKFFDVVTYTGNGVAGRQISHSLGQTPGMVVIKCTNSGEWWVVQHRSIPATQVLNFNNTNAATTWNVFNNTYATSTSFTVSADNASNGNGNTYVAYLFAHDTTTDGLIQCGSFTTNSSGAATVSLGWEPQYLLLKNSSSTQTWYVADTMRGFGVTSWSYLQPNSSAAEATATTLAPTSTGFDILSAGNSNTYIYMAIRRGPMKTPTDGTKVFNNVVRTGTDAAALVNTTITPDLIVHKGRGYTSSVFWLDRLRDNYYIVSDATVAETNNTSLFPAKMFDNQFGYDITGGSLSVNSSASSYIDWVFRRAPGFFDVVCYTGTGVARTVNHNLGVAPELMIVKSRINGTYNWNTYAAPLTADNRLHLASTSGAFSDGGCWESTEPSATVFTVGGNAGTNESAGKYVAYLFASCPGVSKVFSFTGNGSSQTINCGFTNGARLVLIKRTDSTGDWYIWDTARGIVAATDPHLSLNTTAAEVTTDDTIDPESTGFIVNQVSATNVNVNGASYIGLAIA